MLGLKIEIVNITHCSQSYRMKVYNVKNISVSQITHSVFIRIKPTPRIVAALNYVHKCYIMDWEGWQKYTRNHN